MRGHLSALTSVLGVLLAGVASADTLPEGRYSCFYDTAFVPVGDIAIAGDTYRGPGFDGDLGASHPYLLKGDKILFQGPLGGFSEAGEPMEGHVLHDAAGAFEGFEIRVYTEGLVVDAHCDPQ